MRRRLLGLLGVCLAMATWVTAQDTPGLTVQDLTLLEQQDAFGQDILVAQGLLENTDTQAYQGISLFAEVYSADDTLIGEGFGYPVKACGEALLPDEALQPGTTERFSVQLDIFEPDESIDRVEIIPQASPAEASTAQTPNDTTATTRINGREVIAVEWIDSDNLRFAVGCWRELFTTWEWFELNTHTGQQSAIDHPRASQVTETTRFNISLMDPTLFGRSFFRFAPDARRAVYQTELNTLVSAEPDGTFPRVLYESLYNISLQGFIWQPNGLFLAYYHGGYGNEVLYSVATVDGQQLSNHPTLSRPSITVPGISPTGRNLVLGLEVADISGYYLKPTNSDATTLLLEADLPGNNYPAPVYHLTENNIRQIYLVRPVDGQNRLQCVNADSMNSYDYTDIPLMLDAGDRSGLWLSPDSRTLALGTTGTNSGLWLVDLDRFPACD